MALCTLHNVASARNPKIETNSEDLNLRCDPCEKTTFRWRVIVIMWGTHMSTKSHATCIPFELLLNIHNIPVRSTMLLYLKIPIHTERKSSSLLIAGRVRLTSSTSSSPTRPVVSLVRREFLDQSLNRLFWLKWL